MLHIEMVMNLEKCPLTRKLDLFNGLVISEKEAKGLHKIINLLKILYSL